jgi:hypothetical protein
MLRAKFSLDIAPTERSRCYGQNSALTTKRNNSCFKQGTLEEVIYTRVQHTNNRTLDLVYQEINKISSFIIGFYCDLSAGEGGGDRGGQ